MALLLRSFYRLGIISKNPQFSPWYSFWGENIYCYMLRKFFFLLSTILWVRSFYRFWLIKLGSVRNSAVRLVEHNILTAINFYEFFFTKNSLKTSLRLGSFCRLCSFDWESALFAPVWFTAMLTIIRAMLDGLVLILRLYNWGCCVGLEVWNTMLTFL